MVITYVNLHWDSLCFDVITDVLLLWRILLLCQKNTVNSAAACINSCWHSKWSKKKN